MFLSPTPREGYIIYPTDYAQDLVYFVLSSLDQLHIGCVCPYTSRSFHWNCSVACEIAPKDMDQTDRHLNTIIFNNANTVCLIHGVQWENVWAIGVIRKWRINIEMGTDTTYLAILYWGFWKCAKCHNLIYVSELWDWSCEGQCSHNRLTLTIGFRILVRWHLTSSPGSSGTGVD